ncbi:acyltransferase family protein [Cupriavidus taiwanensis]|uniref:acyltransferase family protein n=1 Tax=Cupriavidus taiwanensis TaxID=164546 RepID=UPI0018DBEB69|nr:acyltransferase family protein [Cupriavidus taiwanensis]
MHNKAQRSYRPDVDGLRAVAVLAVLLFHADSPLVPGGFIGVDVFFVISGYLITKILRKDCEGGHFSYPSFLARRFFRLYPALLVTLALTWVAGFLLLSPEHFKALGEYTGGAQFSVSNIVFLWNTGYFAEAAGTNPLLHTWSLAVEQQFYLFWPILIFLAFKIGRGAVPLVVALAGVASLLWSQHSVGASPDGAYFLVQSRVFEFAVGAMLPWVELRKPKHPAVTDILLLVGLATLVYCATTYTKTTPFPGISALLPCVAAALCIYAGQARATGLLLRNPLMVWIGTISYSLYLVHWPIFVLYRYYHYGPLSTAETVAMFLAPFVAAYPMFKLVEVPFRRLRFGSLGLGRATAATSVSALIAVGAWYAYSSNGLAWRVDVQSTGRLDGGRAFYEANFGGAGFEKEAILGDIGQSKISLLLIGDSFAGHLVSGLSQVLAEHHLKAISVWESGCLVSLKYVTGRNGVADPKCMKSSARALDLAKSLGVPIVYAQSWDIGGYKTLSMEKRGGAVKFSGSDEYNQFLVNNIADLSAATNGQEIFVIGSTPGDGSTQGVNLRACLNRPTYIPSDCQNYLVFKQDFGIGRAENDALIDALKSMPNVTFLDPYDIFCKDGGCRALLDDRVLYSDAAHLSRAGSMVVAQHLIDKILPRLQQRTVTVSR